MSEDRSMDRQFISKLTAILQENLEQDSFGVVSLAREIGLSKSQLLRKLQAIKGKSTSQFIREYRLQKAMELLQQGVGTASEVGYRVGFSSPTYFSSCFHDYFGYPPGEVKYHKNGNEILQARHSTSQSSKTSKRRMLLLSSLAAVLLLATSFVVYLRTQNVKDTHSTNVLSISATDKKSIAVLPFTNLSGDESIEYISDGMTDEIISQLTKIKAFGRVIPATTMMSYKKTDKSVMEIAGELGVTHLLEGNVQKAGDTVKIVLRLIDGKSNTYNWSDNFKSAWQIEDLFKMQTEVAENLARNMNVSLSSEDRVSLKQLPTLSSDAYMYYRQAEYQRVRWDYQGFQNAISLYEEAISLDPSYIDALMGLAYVWMVQGLWWGTLDENRAWTKSRELLQKILSMDPSNKEAELSLYMGYFYYDWNFAIVEPYFQNHRTLPVFGDWSGLGDYAQKTGRWEEALRITEAFIDWEPMVGKHYIEKANILQNLGRTEEASALLQHTDLLYSDNFYYLRGSAVVHYELKEYEKSRDRLDIIFNRFIDRPPEVLWLNAILMIQEGRQRESQEQLLEIRQQYEKGAGGSPAYFIALYYFTLEDYDSGFEWLEKSYERHEVEMTRLMESQVLVSVAQDPRYKELWHKVGFSKVIKS